MRKLKGTIFACAMLFIGFNAQAQAIKKADLAKTWDTVTNMFISTAKNMPAEHYGWKPHESVATFGELVGHTAGANYLYGPTVNGPKSQRPSPDTSSKTEMVEALEGSFKYVKDAIAKLDNSNMEEEIDWFGSKMPRIKAIMGMMDHVQREYGKVITYARLKGVKPEPGRGW